MGVNLLHIVLLKSKLYCKVFSCLAPNLTLTVYPMGHAIHTCISSHLMVFSQTERSRILLVYKNYL